MPGQPDDLGPAIEHDLADAIATVLARHETSMVTKWIALIETMNDEGERGMWTMTSDNVKAWDTTGMLQHGLHMQQAEITASYLGNED